MGKPFPLHPKPGARQVAGMSKREPKPRVVRKLVLRVRCTEEERSAWLRKARAQERSLSDYARHLLSDAPTQRRARPPEVDPVLLAAVGRAGNNLNQIARAINTDRKAGRAIDLIAVRTLLMALDRQLAEIVAEHSR
ncbi:mobilisation protein (MobC) [Celeribacter neptunius]|uniref:Mobilisation protein (MobC) n=2 Tax=Celeribacter neptunius TaxID=588602 RepID=A0A1I3TU71_9RHOB|nr:mobilisation protein (MobC) [Celeribacter neptunius]